MPAAPAPAHRSAGRVVPLEVEVGAALPFAGPHVVRGLLMAPDHVEPTAPLDLVYCLAGGGATAGSFDLQVDGLPGYSLAVHLVEEGCLVVAVDHPGVGTSAPVPDLYELDVDVVAAAHAHVVRTVLGGLRRGDLAPGVPPLAEVLPIGLGHSMGAMVLVVLQASEGLFEGIVVLGHGGGGLPEVLTDEESALVGSPRRASRATIVELARTRFGPASTVARTPLRHGVFFAEDVRPAVVTAMAEQQAELLPTCGLETLLPGIVAPEMGVIDVPVFLGLGERDIIADPHQVVRSYTGTRDLHLFVLPGAGHCQNQAPNRHELWARLSWWMHGAR